MLTPAQALPLRSGSHETLYRLGGPSGLLVSASVHPTERDARGRPLMLTNVVGDASAFYLFSLEALHPIGDRKLAREIEVESQYFQGAGAEGWDDVSTGAGSSEAEALVDALESISHGWDVEALAAGLDAADETDVVRERLESTARPRMMRLSFSAFSGCSPEPRLFEVGDEATVLEEVRKILQGRAKSGHPISDLNGGTVEYAYLQTGGLQLATVQDLCNEETPSVALPSIETLTEEPDTSGALIRFGGTLRTWSWECEEPEGCAMVPDTAGVLTLELLAGDMDDERFTEASELYYYVSVRVREEHSETPADPLTWHAESADEPENVRVRVTCADTATVCAIHDELPSTIAGASLQLVRDGVSAQYVVQRERLLEALEELDASYSFSLSGDLSVASAHNGTEEAVKAWDGAGHYPHDKAKPKSEPVDDIDTVRRALPQTDNAAHDALDRIVNRLEQVFNADELES